MEVGRLYVKGQIVNISNTVGHTVSGTTIQLCLYSKAKHCGQVPITFIFKSGQGEGQLESACGDRSQFAKPYSRDMAFCEQTVEEASTLDSGYI